MKTKHLLLILTISTVFFAQPNNIMGSINIVGYRQCELPPAGEMILIGVNFSTAGKDPTLKGLLGTKQLRAASVPVLADRVFLWNPKKDGYDSYAQYSENKQFYRCDQWLTSAPVNPIIPRGTGFWIASASDSTTTNSIVISGDVTVGPPIKHHPRSKTQVIANPFPAETTVDILTQRFKPRPGDRVAFWMGHDYNSYTLQSDGKWLDNGKSKSAPKVSVGEAIWLTRKNPPAKKKGSTNESTLSP